MYRCPKCKNEVRKEDAVCPHCGEQLISFSSKTSGISKTGKIFAIASLILFSIGYICLMCCDFVYMFMETKQVTPTNILIISFHGISAICALFSLFWWIFSKRKEFSLLAIILAVGFDNFYHGFYLVNVAETYLDLFGSGESFLISVFGIVAIVFTFLPKIKPNVKWLFRRIFAMTAIFGATITLLDISQGYYDSLNTYNLYIISRWIILFGSILYFFYCAFGFLRNITVTTKAEYVPESQVKKETVVEENIVEAVVEEVKPNKSKLEKEINDKIKRLQELVDIHAITQEEFEQKKKELLKKLED